MDIMFTKTGNEYRARLHDTEIRVSYDASGWSLNWLIYGIINACEAAYSCHHLDCDLDDLTEENMAEDEYCHNCPRTMTETSNEDSYTSDTWNKTPRNLDEARILILEQYKNLPHNGLYDSNKNFCDMMYGSWKAG